MKSPDHNPVLDRKTWLRLPVLALFALLACLALPLRASPTTGSKKTSRRARTPTGRTDPGEEP